jgi:hypothetical protein
VAAGVIVAVAEDLVASAAVALVVVELAAAGKHIKKGVLWTPFYLHIIFL